jgi:hypothetical protein
LCTSNAQVQQTSSISILLKIGRNIYDATVNLQTIYDSQFHVIGMKATAYSGIIFRWDSKRLSVELATRMDLHWSAIGFLVNIKSPNKTSSKNT